MNNQTICSNFNIKNRFLRSINLQRDFRDSNALNSYVLTDYSIECLQRISEGMKENSSQRAWRITGDYGSGKSNFALFLTHWLNTDTDELPAGLRQKLLEEGVTNNKSYFPVLITGSREPMGEAILKSLDQSLTTFSGSASIQHEIRDIITKKAQIGDSVVIKYLNKVKDFICKSKNDGLILIIDELGKFLEYAALHPEEQDIYLIQRLAENSSGSGSKPLIFIGILHQGFSAYADSLTQASQHEWEKVAGRFDEILFNQPLAQLAYIINSALGIGSSKLDARLSKSYCESLTKFISYGWYGHSVTPDCSAKLAPKIYPLHPSVFPAVVDAFRRFGQNERSLFSFLLSNDSYGIQEYSSTHSPCQPYRLFDLYDYIRFNFGHKLNAQSYKSYWHVIDSLIDSFVEEDELELKVLKTIGVLNLLDNNKFIANKNTIREAFAGNGNNADDIDSVLQKLCKARVIYNRGSSGGYCLWPHSSVNLDAAYQKAQDMVGKIKNVGQYLKDSLTPRPIVARRHYINTGNLRAFEIIYCSTNELENIASILNSKFEGHIIIPLCESLEEQKKCLTWAQSNIFADNPEILCAVPKPLNALTGLIKEVKLWQYIEQNTLELNSDIYACEEVKRQQRNAFNNLENRLDNFIDVKSFSESKNLQWFRQGKKEEIKNGRDLLSKLSGYFDEIYFRAPSIKNELVNRGNISSAAAAARMRLITRILEYPNVARLGIDADKTPPEAAIYLSILLNGGIHVSSEGKWLLQIPGENRDICNLLPSFNKLDEILKTSQDEKISVKSIYETLKAPPFGLREGIIPILLAIYYSIFEHDIAVYEDGSFLRQIREQEFLRLTKAPDSFEFQYCSIKGVRTEIFLEILSVLNLPKKSSKPHLLDIVRPLCNFVAKLPEYVIKTKLLSEKAINVRKAILDSHEPVKLIFHSLPIACELSPVTPESIDSNTKENFISSLKEAYDELRFCYNALLDRLQKHILSNFIFEGKLSDFRKDITTRSNRVLLWVTDPKLKAFALRLGDNNLGDNEWVESITAFICSKTPEHWKDSDEENFYREFPAIVKRYLNVESIAFKQVKELDSGKIGCKISLTKATGEEISQVMYYSKKEEIEIKKFQDEICKLIAKNPRLGMVAASQEILKNLL